MQEEDYAVLRSRGVEQLMASKEMKALRVAAQHKRLDLSDAFESSAGRGVNALIGEMPRNRFCSTLGGLFGGELKEDVLKAICAVYGCGDPDRFGGGKTLVAWRDFCNDFLASRKFDSMGNEVKHAGNDGIAGGGNTSYVYTIPGAQK